MVPGCGDTRLRPPTAGCAGRRPAFQAVPALLHSRRHAVSRPCGRRCRRETPTGRIGRRSLAGGTTAPAEDAPSGNHPGMWRYATPPAYGGLCRPPPGELARGRRSKPSPRFFTVGGTRFRGPLGRGAGVNTGVPSRPAPPGPLAVPPDRGSPQRRAGAQSCIARQTFSGVSGVSRCSTPYGWSASITALTTAGVEPMVAASPIPFTPRGLTGVGVTVRCSS